MAADEGAGWWKTLPGMLTAVAAVITAGTGLVLGLHEIGFFDASPQASSTSIASPGGDGLGEYVDARDSSGSAEPSASTSSPTRQGAYEATLPLEQPKRAGETSYEILGYEIRPDADGTIALSLAMRMTNHRAYGDNFWDQAFRLVIADDTYAPSSGLNEVVQGGATARGDVLFVIPETSREAELLITVKGDELLSIPFELRPID